AEFEDCVASACLHEPKTPFVSTLSGHWANAAVTQPRYWRDQLRSAVRFADALRAVEGPNSPVAANPMYLEVGPGRALTTFAALTTKKEGSQPSCLNSLPVADDGRSDTETIFAMLGALWVNGASVDWAGFHETERRRRVSLPTYPFERRSYWIGPLPGG